MQVSTATGAAKVHRGARALGLAALLNKQLGLPSGHKSRQGRGPRHPGGALRGRAGQRLPGQLREPALHDAQVLCPSPQSDLPPAVPGPRRLPPAIIAPAIPRQDRRTLNTYRRLGHHSLVRLGRSDYDLDVLADVLGEPEVL